MTGAASAAAGAAANALKRARRDVGEPIDESPAGKLRGMMDIPPLLHRLGDVHWRSELISGAAYNLKGRKYSITGAAYSTSDRSEEHTSELQSLMRISYAVFCLKKKKTPSL